MGGGVGAILQPPSGGGGSLRGHLMQPGPLPPMLPEVRPPTEANLLRGFSALLCRISFLSRSHGFLFRTGSKITLLSFPFPFPLGTLG